jgi:hypothetical protein
VLAAVGLAYPLELYRSHSRSSLTRCEAYAPAQAGVRASRPA